LQARHDKKTALQILSTDTDGILRTIDGADAVRALPQTAELRIFPTPGSRVRRYTQAGHKIGYLLLVADTYAELREAQAKAKSLLRFGVEPDAPGTAATAPAAAPEPAAASAAPIRTDLLTEKR
ncbi:biotin carboxylase, partial [Streptomyces halstedii]